MRVLYERCAGLDVHKQTVVACVLTSTEQGTATPEVKTFRTMTRRLRQWASTVRRLSAQALRRYPDQKRHTYLLAFLVVRSEEITNIIVEMFDQLVGRIFVRSDEEVEQTKVTRARFLQSSAKHMRKVSEIVVSE